MMLTDFGKIQLKIINEYVSKFPEIERFFCLKIRKTKKMIDEIYTSQGTAISTVFGIVDPKAQYLDITGENGEAKVIHPTVE